MEIAFDSVEGQLQVTDSIELGPFPKNELFLFVCFFVFVIALKKIKPAGLLAIFFLP